MGLCDQLTQYGMYFELQEKIVNQTRSNLNSSQITCPDRRLLDTLGAAFRFPRTLRVLLTLALA